MNTKLVAGDVVSVYGSLLNADGVPLNALLISIKEANNDGVGWDKVVRVSLLVVDKQGMQGTYLDVPFLNSIQPGYLGTYAIQPSLAGQPAESLTASAPDDEPLRVGQRVFVSGYNYATEHDFSFFEGIPMAGKICYVDENDIVNIAFHDHYGESLSATGVPFVRPGRTPPKHRLYCHSFGFKSK